MMNVLYLDEFGFLLLLAYLLTDRAPTHIDKSCQARDAPRDMRQSRETTSAVYVVGSHEVTTKRRNTFRLPSALLCVPTACPARARRLALWTNRFEQNPTTQSSSSFTEVLQSVRPRGHLDARDMAWTGWTAHCAHALEVALVRQAGRHDRCRSRADRIRERQPPDRPHPARDDHLLLLRTQSAAWCTTTCRCHDVRRKS